LEARVALQAEPATYDFLKTYEADLPTLFIVSQVTLKRVEAVSREGHLVSDTPGFAVDVSRAHGTKCERCWNYRESVGADQEHPTLCDPCVEAIR
ncbi:MAG: zinc finger domain-containing protein, partial [Nitrospiraceae bacterium]